MTSINALRIVLIAALVALLSLPADAYARKGAAGGRLANASVSGFNRPSTMPAGNPGRTRDRDRSRVDNNGNIGSTGNIGNNVNIGNDVNIDIDHGYNNWGGRHYPLAPGVVIGTVAVTRAAVVGSYYYSLPAGCTTVYRDGLTYYYCGSVYYSRTWYGNDVVYVVVNP